MSDSNFSFWVPFEIAKGHVHVEGEEPPMRIAGIVSSESVDADDEVVLQDAIDWTYFLQKGWLNDNHDQSTGAGVGYPINIETVELPNGKKATRMVGELFDTPEGRKIWGLAKACGGHRSLGFSLEGSITSRSGPGGKVISKARVRDCSITRHPKNPDATLRALCKSLRATEAPPAPVAEAKPSAWQGMQKSLTVRRGRWAGLRKALAAGNNEPADTSEGNPLVPQEIQRGKTASKDRPADESDKEAISKIMKRLDVDEKTARRVYEKLKAVKAAKREN